MKQFRQSILITIIFVLLLPFLCVSDAFAVEEGGHVWGEWITDVAPTCETAGHRYRVCTAIPDLPHTQEQILAPLGHIWGDWVTVHKATSEEDGLMQRICTRDPSHIEEMPIPKLPPEPATEPTAAVPESDTVPVTEPETTSETIPVTIPPTASEPESTSDSTPETTVTPLPTKPPQPPSAPRGRLTLDIVLSAAFLISAGIISRILYRDYKVFRWDRRQKQALLKNKKGGVFCNVSKPLD